jgi:hypothetical protein
VGLGPGEHLGGVVQDPVELAQCDLRAECGNNGRDRGVGQASVQLADSFSDSCNVVDVGFGRAGAAQRLAIAGFVHLCANSATTGTRCLLRAPTLHCTLLTDPLPQLPGVGFRGCGHADSAFRHHDRAGTDFQKCTDKRFDVGDAAGTSVGGQHGGVAVQCPSESGEVGQRWAESLNNGLDSGPVQVWLDACHGVDDQAAVFGFSPSHVVAGLGPPRAHVRGDAPRRPGLFQVWSSFDGRRRPSWVRPSPPRR